MKALEFAYLLVAYFMGGIIYYINRNDDYLTVSETAANSKVGRQAFFWGLFLAGLLYLYLMVHFMIPHFHLPVIFKYLAAILFIFQVLTGLIPARGKKMNTAHLILAFSLSFLLLTTVLALAAQATIRSYARVLCGLFGLIMIGVLMTAHKLSATKYFRHQNIFFGCWHLALMVVVFIG